MRCHRVDDHSKATCWQKFEKTCDRGHKLRIPCHKRSQNCSMCVREDVEAERRIKRDLKLEADRQARQAAYKQELQEIQDEIDHQRRIIKYQKDKEEQKKTLAQRRADLAALRDTAIRVTNTKKSETKPEQKPGMPGSFPSANPPSPPDTKDSLDTPEGARQEWEHMKQFEGAVSKPLDELMAMIGLEEVKSEFVAIKSRVDTALRQDISLEKERFSCSMLGNPGTGEFGPLLARDNMPKLHCSLRLTR